ncbi:MAG: hypothetical protein F6K26_43070, partial [Moorea sp. SIO2I5]|nr:hypothetical protein [Moorena sp. SIO2I5]
MALPKKAQGNSKGDFKRCIPDSRLPTPSAIDSMKKNTMANGHGIFL